MRLYRICPENLLENYSGRGASFQDGGALEQGGVAGPVLCLLRRRGHAGDGQLPALTAAGPEKLSSGDLRDGRRYQL